MKFRHDSFNAKCDCATPMYKCARSYLTYCLRLCDRLRMVCVSLSSFSIICFSGCSFWSIKAFSLVNIRLVRSSMYLSSLVSFAYCRCAREWRKHFECNNFDMKRSVYCWVSIVIGLWKHNLFPLNVNKKKCGKDIIDLLSAHKTDFLPFFTSCLFIIQLVIWFFLSNPFIIRLTNNLFILSLLNLIQVSMHFCIQCKFHERKAQEYIGECVHAMEFMSSLLSLQIKDLNFRDL